MPGIIPLSPLMCQHFSGHKITQLFAEFQSLLVTNNHCITSFCEKAIEIVTHFFRPVFAVACNNDYYSLTITLGMHAGLLLTHAQ
jgi:hypothetical protein